MSRNVIWFQATSERFEKVQGSYIIERRERKALKGGWRGKERKRKGEGKAQEGKRKRRTGKVQKGGRNGKGKARRGEEKTQEERRGK